MSYLNSTLVTAGSAAEQASTRKKDVYAALAISHIFIPIAIGTISQIRSKVSSFLQKLGRRLSVTTGNSRESAFLFQQLSVALQRYNTVCIRGTFGAIQDSKSNELKLVVAYQPPLV